MDLFSTAELRKVIVDSRPPVQYFLDRLYNEQINFTTEEIMFDELKLGLRITVYAESFPPHTTSDLAGGQFVDRSNQIRLG